MLPLNAPYFVNEQFNAISIGTTAFMVESKIIDQNGKQVEDGEVGEILMKCPGVVRGYFKSEEKTRETIDAEGFIHSGDVGFRTKEGHFFVVDRIKDLIISSGYKIYPKEVEDIIYECVGVREVAVVGLLSSF